jgi:hypothetical protein
VIKMSKTVIRNRITKLLKVKPNLYTGQIYDIVHGNVKIPEIDFKPLRVGVTRNELSTVLGRYYRKVRYDNKHKQSRWALREAVKKE